MREDDITWLVAIQGFSLTRTKFGGEAIQVETSGVTALNNYVPPLYSAVNQFRPLWGSERRPFLFSVSRTPNGLTGECLGNTISSPIYRMRRGEHNETRISQVLRVKAYFKE